MTFSNGTLILIDYTAKVKNTDEVFDTTIEAKSYIQGCVDSVVTFTKGANESKLLSEFEIRDVNDEHK